MHKIVIYNLLGQVIDKIHTMRPPEESQIQTFWIESLKKHGVFIILKVETVKYIELGEVA